MSSLLRKITTAIKVARKGKELFEEVAPFVSAVSQVIKEKKDTSAVVELVSDRGETIAVWNGYNWENKVCK